MTSLDTLRYLASEASGAMAGGVRARLWSDESGQDLIEYALIAALIGLAAILSVKGLSTKLNALFSSITTDLQNVI